MDASVTFDIADSFWNVYGVTVLLPWRQLELFFIYHHFVAEMRLLEREIRGTRRDGCQFVHTIEKILDDLLIL